MGSKPPKGWMTTDEFAEAINYHPVTVRKMVIKKAIKSWKRGMNRFIHKSELERFKPPHD